MHKTIQQETAPEGLQIQNLKIEVLYERLKQVTNQQEKNELLQELEMLTGVKLFY